MRASFPFSSFFVVADVPCFLSVEAKLAIALAEGGPAAPSSSHPGSGVPQAPANLGSWILSSFSQSSSNPNDDPEDRIEEASGPLSWTALGGCKQDFFFDLDQLSNAFFSTTDCIAASIGIGVRKRTYLLFKRELTVSSSLAPFTPPSRSLRAKSSCPSTPRSILRTSSLEPRYG